MTIYHGIFTFITELIAFGTAFAVVYHHSGNMRRAFYTAVFAYAALGVAYFVLLPLPIGGGTPETPLPISFVGAFTKYAAGGRAAFNALLSGFGFSLLGGMLYERLRKLFVLGGVWLAVGAAYAVDVFATNRLCGYYARMMSAADGAALALGLLAGWVLANYFIRSDPTLSDKIHAVKLDSEALSSENK